MVDDLSIVDEIDRLKEPMRQAFAYSEQLQRNLSEGKNTEENNDNQLQMNLRTLLRPLIAMLNQHPVLGNREDKFFYTKQISTNPHYQAHNLLHLAISEGEGGEAAVAWLHRVVATDTADLRFVAEVHGLEVNERHTLRNGVVFMPLDELPASENARIAIAQYRELMPWETFNFPVHRPVGAALLVPGVAAVHGRLPANRRSLENELARTVRAFTLAGATPTLGTSWVEFTNPDLARAEIGRMWRGVTSEVTPARGLPTEINADALSWVDRYLRLRPEVLRSCDVAIERLNLARRRNAPGDRAIEGAICLEALLGDGGTQELTYKLKLRAALLLASGLDERRRIAKEVGEFYNLRSKTVHGRIPNEKDARDDILRADRGLEICAAALREIVRRNRKFVPHDWELSGGPPLEDN